MKMRAKRKLAKHIPVSTDYKMFDYFRKIVNKSVTTYNTQQDSIIHTWIDIFTSGWCNIFAEVLSRKFKLPMECIFEERLITSKGNHHFSGHGLVHAYVLIPKSYVAMDITGAIKTEGLFDSYGFWPKLHESDPEMWVNMNSRPLLNKMFSDRKFILSHNYQIYRNEANFWRKRAKRIIREVFLSHFRNQWLSVMRNKDHQLPEWHDHWNINRPFLKGTLM